MRKRRSTTPAFKIIVFLIVLIGVFIGFKAWDIARGDPLPNLDGVEFQTFDAIGAPGEEEKEGRPSGKPYAVSTASVGVTGDVLIHSPIYKSVKQEDGSYDFTENYEFIKPYFEKYDCMVANLEVTLGGGTPSSYPLFNCPDSILDALKGAGVDLLLTANNHSNDTRTAGIKRTVQKVREQGFEYVGTRDNTEDSFHKVVKVGGIKVGMACFTYSTLTDSGSRILNGNKMDKTADVLLSSFDPERLEDFYKQAEDAIKELKADGAETLMFYLHWGYEYRYTPADHQKKIAKKLCELGVDVIVGGHPHVIQPFETIRGDNGNEALCIYSTGNAISNQRRHLMDSDGHSGHTEDGMIFGVTFEKWSDGSVRIKEVEILPTWILLDRVYEEGGAVEDSDGEDDGEDGEEDDGRAVFRIVPLDPKVSDWKKYDLDETTLKDAYESYARTLKLVGTGLNEARTKLGLSEMPLTAN